MKASHQYNALLIRSDSLPRKEVISSSWPRGKRAILLTTHHIFHFIQCYMNTFSLYPKQGKNEKDHFASQVYADFFLKFQSLSFYFIQILYLNMLSEEIQQQKALVEKIPTLKIVDGRYQIKDKLLGKGSFASTFLCIDTKTGNVIACKMVSKKHLIQKINLSKNKSLTKEYFIHSLKTEVKTWKSIHHKNIVQFIDFSQTPNNIYFFLEYCSGGNLESLLRHKGAFSQKKSVPFMIQLINGCDYLYEQGIYHRDLKTQNILIHQGQLKLSDFGFAKVVSDEQLKNSPNHQTSVGTPIYMSPQVLLGEPYTIKCDVWSLGVVFYKMLYNIYPWQKTDNLVVLTKRMQEPIHFPPNIKVAEWIPKMIKGMLNVDESTRLSISEVKKLIQVNTNTMDLQ